MRPAHTPDNDPTNTIEIYRNDYDKLRDDRADLLAALTETVCAFVSPPAHLSECDAVVIRARAAIARAEAR